jgi:hypothetical protein
MPVFIIENSECQSEFSMISGRRPEFMKVNQTRTRLMQAFVICDLRQAQVFFVHELV